MTSKPLTVRNVDIGEYSSSYSGFIGRSNRSLDYDSAGTTYSGYLRPGIYVGGLVGYSDIALNNDALTVDNCNLSNIDMYGGRVGGLAGHLTSATVSNTTIHATNISDDDYSELSDTMKAKNAEKKHMIEGWYYTGGWVGSTGNNGRVRSFDSCTIENYTVLGNNLHNDSSGSGVGGWIGINDNSYSTVILSNVAMLDCDVKGSEFGATEKYGIGGFVGRHKGIIKGYNGLIKNLRLTADDRGVAGLNYTTISKSYHGAVIGANMDNAWCNVRIAGLSVQADDGYTIYDDWDSRRPAKGTSQSPNLNYVIHADTLGSSLSDTLHSYTFSGFTDGATNVSYTENSANPAVGSLRTVDTISSTTVNGVTRSTHNRAFSLTDPVSSEINNQKTTSGSTTTIVSQKNYFDNFPFNYPYVTSSPFTMIGETAFITGDGVRICGKSTDSNGELVLTLPADSISAASGTTLATDITNYNAKKSMFSTYETEIGSLPDGCQDFPVIVTDGNNVTDLNNLIDSYIRVLTQAGDDMDTLSGLKFNTTNASNSTYKDLVFQIAVRKIVYRDGNFEDDGAAQGLTLDSRGFRVNIRYPDNGNTPQFTLIDVQFFNPVTPSEVAYHLYVPVLVKKLIKFNCVTSSLPSAYYGEAQFGTQNPSVCALGTPVTFYARYTYQNTIQDWQNALNVGDSLMWHYNKQITLTMGANIDLMPEGTRMILVDKNLNDKAFYGTGSYTAQDGIFTKSVESNGDHTLTVDLSKFKSQEDDTTLHGDSVQDFGERINIKAIKYEDATTEQKEAAQVTYITTQDQSIAYARATEVGETESGYYTIYNESDYTESNQPQRYILLIDEGNDSTAVLPLTETYYLTFFTDKSDTELRILTAQSAQTLSTSTVASHPSRRDDTSNHSNPTSLILGDLFQQVFNYFVTDAKQIDGDTGLINQQKKYVDAMISTTISFKDNEDVTKALPYISSNSVKLYHCFLIKMTKNDGFTTETTITGNPTIESADNKPEFSGYQTIYQSKSIHYSGITTTNSGQASYCNSAVFSASPPNGKNYILLTETNGSGELLDIKKPLSTT